MLDFSKDWETKSNGDVKAVLVTTIRASRVINDSYYFLAWKWKLRSTICERRHISSLQVALMLVSYTQFTEKLTAFLKGK